MFSTSYPFLEVAWTSKFGESAPKLPPPGSPCPDRDRETWSFVALQTASYVELTTTHHDALL